MTVNDVPGRVTVCRNGWGALFADEPGVTVRSALGRVRRFSWSEISCFADGSRTVEGGEQWVLQIVLRAGEMVPVRCTAAVEASPEMLTAVRQVAELYGILADLAGVAMENGQPPRIGLYEDPGGEAGMRYWEGTQWSPLLQPGSGRWPQSVKKSAASWATLPIAPAPWAYPAVEAARIKRWARASAIPTAALVVAGLVAGLWWRWYDAGVWFFIAAFPGMFLGGFWLEWRQYQKLKKLVVTAPTGHTNWP